MLEKAAGLIYGTIVVAALLDAESAVKETYAETVAGVVIAVLVYWLAHAYATFAGQRLSRRETFHLSDLTQALVEQATILAGAMVPLGVLLIGWAAGASLDTAVNIGIYTSAAMLLLIELVSGLRAHLSGPALLIQTLFGATLGALVIALKLVFH